MATTERTRTATSREAALVNLRSTLDWLGDEVNHISEPVDPIIEMTGITKDFDGSKALVADEVTGYPHARMYSNLYATPERTARLFGVDEYKDIKGAVLDAYRNPIAPTYVGEEAAPCQEIDLVNGHEFGNSAAIFARDGHATRRFFEEIDVGMIGVNVPIPVPAGYHNFGRLKRSKFGEGHLSGRTLRASGRRSRRCRPAGSPRSRIPPTCPCRRTSSTAERS